jgi:hypothetical protein
MKNIKTLDQIKDKYYGLKGTPERDELERELESPAHWSEDKRGTRTTQDDTGAISKPH